MVTTRASRNGKEPKKESKPIKKPPVKKSNKKNTEPVKPTEATKKTNTKKRQVQTDNAEQGRKKLKSKATVKEKDEEPIKEEIIREDLFKEKKPVQEMVTPLINDDASIAESSVADMEEDEEDDDEDESIDWETVQLQPPVEEEAPVYNDVEIVMNTPRPVLKKSHWEMEYQRNLRSWMHNCHVLLLIAHYRVRNKWCSTEVMKSACDLVVPDHAKQLLRKDSSKSGLTTAIKWLLKWWKQFFNITGTGLIARPFSDFGKNSFKVLKEKQASDEMCDLIPDLESFMQLLNTKSGTRDTSAELFVAILRSCGCDARLVCSLQPLPYKISPGFTAVAPPVEKKAEEEEKPSEVVFKFRAKSKTYVDPNDQLKEPRAKPPTVWAEVYCTDTKEWMCIDPVRGHIDKPAAMEPALLDRTNNVSFILAFDYVRDGKRRGNITDVTRRYTSNFEKAMRLRERPLTKREMEGGMKLWSDSLLTMLSGANKITEREVLEQEDLDAQQTNEVMPTAIGNFKNHPLYALERHLLKFETLHPKGPVLGKIRGEDIYPRECVKNVSTADHYWKLGKEIIEGEQPVKMVKANAVTIERKRMKELAKQDGHDMMVACYGDWQTKPYVPSPIVDGKIVKNAYGTIDLFTPAMLPEGAAHIPIKGIAKMAKKLGISYAEAVVDFEFVKMRSVPVVQGIVVPKEQEYILLEAWEEHEKDEAIKAISKQEKEVYVRWRKLIKGLLIKARVDNDYGTTKESTDNNEQMWSNFHKSNDEELEEGGGGFLPE